MSLGLLASAALEEHQPLPNLLFGLRLQLTVSPDFSITFFPGFPVSAFLPASCVFRLPGVFAQLAFPGFPI